jgi:hypothetical protein
MHLFMLTKEVSIPPLNGVGTKNEPGKLLLITLLSSLPLPGVTGKIFQSTDEALNVIGKILDSLIDSLRNKKRIAKKGKSS